MGMLRQGLAATLIACWVPGLAVGQALNVLQTDTLRLLYQDPATTYLVPHAARSFENSLRGQQAIFGYRPSEPVTVLMLDFSDSGNAGAIPLPRNTVLVDVAPKSYTFETSESAERMYSWMNHELVHLVSTEMAAAEDLRIRRLLGGKVAATAAHPESILYEYLTVPRLAAPLWYHEGIAVFAQTWMAGGFGRAQGAYDEMVFRAMVRDGAHFYDPLGLAAEGIKADFQVGVNAYLYGTRFMSYLAWVTSPADVVEWIARRDGSPRHYRDQFRAVFGRELDDVWAEWIEWERGFQQANLAAIRRHPVTPQRRLSQRALGSVSRAWLDEGAGKLYAGVRYPGTVSHIAALDLADGTLSQLQDIKGPLLFRVTSLAHDPAQRALFYTTDNGAHRDLMRFDLASGKASLLQKDLRVGELAFNRVDRSLWGVRHLNGIATIVRMEAPWTDWKQVHSFDYGTTPFDLDISPDGRLLSMTIGEINGDQFLRVHTIEDVLGGRWQPVLEQSFGLAVPESFVFSPDGRYLFGSSYYTGVSNIFRIELASGEMRAVSNAETGYFRPLPRSDGSLVVFEYTGEGFTPVLIDPVPIDDLGAITFFGQQLIEKHPTLKDWAVPSPGSIDLDPLITAQGPYAPGAGIALQSIYPIVEGYKSSLGAGVHAIFSDPIGFNRLAITASATPNRDGDEQSHLRIRHEYQRLDQFLPGRWTTELSWNKADFYDLFGPTRVSRKGYAAELTYQRPLVVDEPRRLDLTLKAGYFGDLDEVPFAQDVAATFDQLARVSARLDGSHVERSLGAVDDEKGWRWSAVAGANHASGDSTPYAWGRFDRGWALPVGHSSIWLRSAAGFAVGERDEVLANYYFGGYRNNYLDHQEVKRYREPFSLPGFDIDGIAGRRFGRGMLEWNLPPVRFSRVGTSDFYLSYARPALFAALLVTDPGDDARRWKSYGGQVDFQFTALSRKEMTLSLGAAIGIDDDGRSHREFMASLKLL